jgi:hypothetical protein
MNEFEKIAKDVAHVIVWPFVNTAKFVTILDDAIKDEPPVKAAIVGLVAAAEKVATDTTVAAVGKGVNVPADIQAVTDAESFFVYFKNSFLPAIESAYKSLAADTK